MTATVAGRTIILSADGDTTALVVAFTGTHTGAANQAALTDSAASFPTAATGLTGWRITNTTDGSSATILSNTATTITATLAGGTDNDWDTGDVYQIIPPTAQVGGVNAPNISPYVRGGNAQAISLQNTTAAVVDLVLTIDGKVLPAIPVPADATVPFALSASPHGGFTFSTIAKVSGTGVTVIIWLQ
jgi:hypothetical protein